MEPNGADTSVEVGAMLFTLVDPSPGHEVAYNRWYERDHFYSGCMIGPWLFAGRRWVATRELKDLRFPDGVPTQTAVANPLDSGSYLATYFIHKGHEPEHFAWTTKQVFELYSHGRGFDERQHAHTSLYFFTSAESADPDGVPAHMALDHPYSGLISVHLDRAEGVDQRSLEAWLATDGRPILFDSQGESTIGQVLNWRPIIPKGTEGDAPMELGTGPGTRQRSMQLLFCTGDPRTELSRVRSYTEAFESAGLASTRLVAPFVPTVPGTDLYTDQLW